MNPFLAVLRREIAERKLLFVGVAFASLFPIVVPWLPGLSWQNPAELRGGMALGLALITSALLALVLGTTVIARDLSERRIGFYFARPVPGWALWAGKMLSAALLSLGAGALILLCARLAGAKIDPTGYWTPGAGKGMSSLAIFAFAALGVLVLLVVGHAVSIMVRSRSPWLAVDLVAFALVATTVWTSNRFLRREGAFEVLAWGALGLAALSLAAVAVAGLVQVEWGRTDLRRGHRLLSLTLWSLVGAATLGHTAYVHWTLQVTPGDLVSIQGVLPAPAGSWIAVTGRVRDRGGYAPTFLLDLGSDRFVKLPGLGFPTFWWRPPLFSQNGSHALWLEALGGDTWQLLTVDLQHPAPALRRTGMIYSGFFGVEASPDGRRVASLAKGRLTVDDLETGRMLASVPMPGEPRLLFLGNGRLRIFRTSHDDEPGMPEVSRLITLDLDVARNRLLPVSRIELPGGRWTSWEMIPDGRRAILRQMDSREAVIADLETGRTFSIPMERSALHFLADGRMVRVRWDGSRHILSLLTPDGAARLQASLPGSRFQFGSNVSPDLLVVATAEQGSYQEIKVWTSWLLDLRTGRLQKIGSGMLPAFDDAGIGSPSAGLFFQGQGGLALFDPKTGRLRTILQGRQIELGLSLARSRMTRFL
jgi:hypothetical protein